MLLAKYFSLGILLEHWFGSSSSGFPMLFGISIEVRGTILPTVAPYHMMPQMKTKNNVGYATLVDVDDVSNQLSMNSMHQLLHCSLQRAHLQGKHTDGTFKN